MFFFWKINSLFFYSPIDFAAIIFSQKIVSFRKRFRAKKSTIRRKWRRMCGFDFKVFWIGDFGANFLRVRSPQDKNQWFVKIVQYLQNILRKLHPSEFRVAGRLAFFDAPRSVHQQNALLRPILQKTVRRNLTVQIRAKFFEDILKTRRNFHTLFDRKTHSVRLPRAVIRILTDNHHASFFQRASSKTRKHIFSRRKNFRFFALSIDFSHQFSKIRLLRLALNKFSPRTEFHI